jgi:hypothetical protein
MRICIPVYDGVNMLDVAGPMEMFFWANRADRGNTECSTLHVPFRRGEARRAVGGRIERGFRVFPRVLLKALRADRIEPRQDALQAMSAFARPKFGSSTRCFARSTRSSFRSTRSTTRNADGGGRRQRIADGAR